VFNDGASYKLETRPCEFCDTGQKKSDDLPQGRSDEVEPEDDRRPTAQHGFALMGSASWNRNSSDVNEALAA